MNTILSAEPMKRVAVDVFSNEGQSIAEYAILLAAILLLVTGTLRTIGPSANQIFSSTASSLHQTSSDPD
jgi:Flp pilus assembly pilin Flp